jgi:hypothetical protein
MTDSTAHAAQTNGAARFHLTALAVLAVLATIALSTALALGAGRELLAGALLVPVIALPALGPLFFTGWMFALDTNR